MAIEQFTEAYLGKAAASGSDRELFEAVNTLLRHGTGICESIVATESAGYSVDFSDVGDGRVRATMECNTRVTLECTTETFLEKGSGHMSDLLIGKSKSLLKTLLDEKEATLKAMFLGPMSRVEEAMKNGLFLAQAPDDPALVARTAAASPGLEQGVRGGEPSERSSSGGAIGADGRLASDPESDACRSAAVPASAEVMSFGVEQDQAAVSLSGAAAESKKCESDGLAASIAVDGEEVTEESVLDGSRLLKGLVLGSRSKAASPAKPVAPLPLSTHCPPRERVVTRNLSRRM